MTAATTPNPGTHGRDSMVSPVDFVRRTIGSAARFEARFSVTKRQMGTMLLLAGFAGYLLLMFQVGTATPFLVTRGASMEPTYHQGDLLLQRRAAPADIREGDVISFRVPPEARASLGLSGAVAHRVIEISAAEGELVFQTQGDNGSVDTFQVPASNVDSVVVRNLGRFGAVFLFLTSGAARIILIPLLLLAAVFGAVELWARAHKQPPPGPGASEVARRGSLERWALEASLGLDGLVEDIASPAWASVELGQPVDDETTDAWAGVFGHSTAEYEAPISLIERSPIEAEDSPEVER